MPKMRLFESFWGQKKAKMIAKIWQQKANSSRKQKNLQKSNLRTGTKQETKSIENLTM